MLLVSPDAAPLAMAVESEHIWGRERPWRGRTVIDPVGVGKVSLSIYGEGRVVVVGTDRGAGSLHHHAESDILVSSAKEAYLASPSLV